MNAMNVPKFQVQYERQRLDPNYQLLLHSNGHSHTNLFPATADRSIHCNAFTMEI